MLLTWIAEVADEPLVLEPTDRRVEWRANTWWLGPEDENRRPPSVSEVVAAFERTARGIRHRIEKMGFAGDATFYVWHDEQAGQLRCSTASVAADQLPFAAAYLPVRELAPIVEAYLSGRDAGVVPWSDLDAVPDRADAVPERPFLPFPVWVRGVGATPAGS